MERSHKEFECSHSTRDEAETVARTAVEERVLGSIISGDRALPHDRFLKRTAWAAEAFASLGLGANDAVALLLRNDIAFLEASRGAALLGAFSVPINRHLSGPEVAFLLRDSGAKVLAVHTDLHPASSAPGRCSAVAARRSEV